MVKKAYSRPAYLVQPAASEPDDSDPDEDDEGTILARSLFRLDHEPIVRGGVYGLTGNAYLVTRAGEVLDAIHDLDARQQPNSATATELPRAALEDEGAVLLESYLIWKLAVQIQRSGKLVTRKAFGALPPRSQVDGKIVDPVN